MGEPWPDPTPWLQSLRQGLRILGLKLEQGCEEAGRAGEALARQVPRLQDLKQGLRVPRLQRQPGEAKAAGPHPLASGEWPFQTAVLPRGRG